MSALPRDDGLGPHSVDRKDSHVTEKLGAIVTNAEVPDTELEKLDEYEAIITAESEFT